MKRILINSVLMASLASLVGCSQSPNMDGTYNTSRKTFFGSDSLQLHVKGETGELAFLGKSIPLKIKIEDERLIAYRNVPVDGMSFYIREHGKRLECTQCEAKEFGGKYWDKVD